MDVSTAQWLQEQGIGATDYFGDATALAMHRAQSADRAEAAAEAERQAERAEAREARAVSMHLAGVQPGAQLARAQAMADVQGEIQGHADEIARLERRLERFRGQAQAEAEALSRSAVLAQRSEPSDPLEVATRRAHEAFRAATRAKWAETGTGPRPFAGGDAVRSEEVTCPECIKCGFTAEQSFMVHHTDVNGNPVAAAPDVPATVPGDAEQRAMPYAYGPGVIVR